MVFSPKPGDRRGANIQSVKYSAGRRIPGGKRAGKRQYYQVGPIDVGEHTVARVATFKSDRRGSAGRKDLQVQTNQIRLARNRDLSSLRVHPGDVRGSCAIQTIDVQDIPREGKIFEKSRAGVTRAFHIPDDRLGGNRTFPQEVRVSIFIEVPGSGGAAADLQPFFRGDNPDGPAQGACGSRRGKDQGRGENDP